MSAGRSIATVPGNGCVLIVAALSMHGDEIECGVVYSHVSKNSPFRLEVAHKDNSTPSLHVRLAQSVDSSSGLRVCRGLKCPGGR